MGRHRRSDLRGICLLRFVIDVCSAGKSKGGRTARNGHPATPRTEKRFQRLGEENTLRLESFIAAAALLVLMPTNVHAASAPVQLRGKSIVVTWTEDRLQRRLGAGQFQHRRIPQSLSIYVSSKGTLFSRRTATGGGRGTKSGSRDTIGGQATTSTGGARVLNFSGHTLSALAGVQQGARAVRVNFDDGFSSCSANVILGRQSGAATMRIKSLVSGETIEIRSSAIEGASCSVRAGNVFR
jgi:hypothetical protein